MILKMENASSKDILKEIEEQIDLPYSMNANNQISSKMELST